jgi:molybdate transport system permease protein
MIGEWASLPSGEAGRRVWAARIGGRVVAWPLTGRIAWEPADALITPTAKSGNPRGVEIPFTFAAVVLADLFVAGPLYVETVRIGFAAVPREVEEAAVLDGATPWDVFVRVALPPALPHVESGALLCWARAVSEFGATLMFAGDLPGRTQTLSLAIMTALERDLGTTLLLSVLLLGTACGIFLRVRLLALSLSTAPP